MTRKEEMVLPCPHCGKEFKSWLYGSVNITLNPELLRELFDCNLNVVECPNCHKRTPVEKNLVFHDMDKGLMLEVREHETIKYPPFDKVREIVENSETAGNDDSFNEKMKKAGAKPVAPGGISSLWAYLDKQGYFDEFKKN